MNELNRPLWQVMRQADSSVASDYQSPEARVLRAIARAIPEELYGVGGVRGWLLNEADRAEAGDAADCP